jgi:hypothetical protein
LYVDVWVLESPAAKFSVWVAAKAASIDSASADVTPSEIDLGKLAEADRTSSRINPSERLTMKAVPIVERSATLRFSVLDAANAAVKDRISPEVIPSEIDRVEAVLAVAESPELRFSTSEKMY